MAALDGQPSGEESPGSTETRCRITSGGGDPRESATENRPPRGVALSAARVKRCGKSAPRDRQRKRHGKPHREQDQIGAAALPATASQTHFRVAARVGRVRRPVTGVPDEWSSPMGNHGNRTRLTGHLAQFPNFDPCRPIRPPPHGEPWAGAAVPASYSLTKWRELVNDTAKTTQYQLVARHSSTTLTTTWVKL